MLQIVLSIYLVYSTKWVNFDLYVQAIELHKHTTIKTLF